MDRGEAKESGVKEKGGRESEKGGGTEREADREDEVSK